MLQVSSRARERSPTVASQPFSLPINPISDLSNAAVCKMLEEVCTITPHIVPKCSDQCLPLLWHQDLHDGNIFVSDEGKVTSIIDWQGVNILPLFLTIRKPQFLDVADNAQLFELPKDMKKMPLSTRSEIWERYSKTMLQGYYLAHFRGNAPTVAAIHDDKQINRYEDRLEIMHELPTATMPMNLCSETHYFECSRIGRGSPEMTKSSLLLHVRSTSTMMN